MDDDSFVIIILFFGGVKVNKYVDKVENYKEKVLRQALEKL